MSSPETRAKALKREAERELLPALKSRLLAQGVEFVLGYDLATGYVIWLCLNRASQPSEGNPLVLWRIHIEIDQATGRMNRPFVHRVG